VKNRSTNKLILSTAILMLQFSLTTNSSAANGKEIVDKSCAGCHLVGVMEAPKIGNTKDWEKRAKQGLSLLNQHALMGFKNMPAKGGNASLSTDDVKSAVAYLLKSAKADKIAAKFDKPVAANIAKAAPVAKKAPVARKPATKNKLASKSQISKANKFNRLMKSASEWNPPQSKDGIHDTDNEGTYALQTPKEAFSQLAKSPSGNRVNWVKALDKKQINPRFDRLDPNKKPFVLDLNIVREVKGSMPDVVYPHKQHTEWLDCSNCHPAIFIPKKGANQISMASILLGEKCGVCHGKVAFPVSECRRCHSKNKPKGFIRK
jgi:c(7)-type cytochrome triheme protein